MPYCKTKDKVRNKMLKYPIWYQQTEEIAQQLPQQLMIMRKLHIKQKKSTKHPYNSHHHTILKNPTKSEHGHNAT
jgi:hypothetical protein